VTQQNNIDARTLKDMLEHGEPVTVVDVRKQEQHAEGSIPGSVNFDAYDALHAGDERAMEGLELPEGARVVTFCNREPGALRRDRRGAAAATGLRSVLLGGRAGSLEEPSAYPCVGPYRSTG
jgi:hypothetical protein